MRSIRGTSAAWYALRQKTEAEKQKSRGRKPFKKLKCYQKRDDKLLFLGFGDYKAYLASDLWKSLRSYKLSRYRNCMVCDAPSTQVHHMSYDADTLRGERMHRLVQLCRGCHYAIEYDGKRKRDVREANAALIKLVEGTERGKSWMSFLSNEENLYKRKVRLQKRAEKRKNH